VNAARGDDATKLPPALARPAHWSGPQDRPAPVNGRASARRPRPRRGRG
jgi:hypothetical protein